METNGIIERCEEKQYKWQLKETRNSFFIYYPQKDKLEEDRIFETDILPLLKVLPDSVLKIWNYAFCEIMNNAIEHSKAEKIGVVFSSNILFTRIFIKRWWRGNFWKYKAIYFKYNPKEYIAGWCNVYLVCGKNDNQ